MITMQYRFGKIDYYGPDGLKKTIPSIIHLGNASKYGIFFWSEVSHIDLEYAEEIVSSIEMLLRGEVDFYEGFGFEVYMIECDREKAVVKNVGLMVKCTPIIVELPSAYRGCKPLICFQ